jgi:hypothetical protein
LRARPDERIHVTGVEDVVVVVVVVVVGEGALSFLDTAPPPMTSSPSDFRFAKCPLGDSQNGGRRGAD